MVRFEDVDVPRFLDGAMQRARHWQVFSRAAAGRRIYPCFCSRKSLRGVLDQATSAPHAPVPIYNGHCRELVSRGVEPDHLACRIEQSFAPERLDFARGDIFGEKFTQLTLTQVLGSSDLTAAAASGNPSTR